MKLKRGDIVLCSMSNDFGKVRPAVIVQNDSFVDVRDSVSLCPLTSQLIPDAVFRPTVLSNNKSGLDTTSQIMVDKLCSIKKSRVKEKLGSLDNNKIPELNEALKLWLGL